MDEIGVSGRILSAVKSLYTCVSACVRINGMCSNWFSINSGLRQGCALSPLLFNLFIDDLANRIKSLGKGISVDDEKVSILLYADDIVLIAENEQDLQYMLNELNQWCKSNAMHVNSNKSNIVHFRAVSCPRTEVTFHCGSDIIRNTDRYVYLGLTLTEHLDYNVTAKSVAQSASRALGFLIAKYKSIAGMPHDVFSKLFDSLVWSVISYGAAIWGYKSFSCINAVQNRAMRFFLGVGKYTPTAAISGDLGWQPAFIKQWVSLSNFWGRNAQLQRSRINRRIFDWANSKGNRQCKNWFYHVKDMLVKIDLPNYTDINTSYPKRKMAQDVAEKLMISHISDWFDTVNRPRSVNGNGRNKLRTYNTFKTEYGLENYCKLIMPFKHRSSMAKFRCGVAPLRIETGRYEGLSEDHRTCPICKSGIENETHVLLTCYLYEEFRTTLFNTALEICNNFDSFSDAEKMKFIFSNPNMIRICAKTCFRILQKRSSFLYS